MSIDLDPTLYDYEPPPNTCNGCFGAAQTPDLILINFNGILRGDDWVPADGEPPNGIWPIPPDGPCHFGAIVNGHDVNYDLVAPVSGLTIDTPLPRNAFIDVIVALYQTWFENAKNVAAGNHFYGGYASITSVVSSDQANLQDIWNSLGEIRQAATYVTPRSKAASETVHTISRRSDHTNIKILFDDS